MRTRLITFVLFLTIPNLAIGQNLAMLYSSTGMEYGKAITVDRSNCYINTSLFQNTINVNPNGITNLSAPGVTTQVAVTKYSSVGNLLWAFHVGGATTSEAPHGVAVDSENNLYLTGYFGSTTTTGPLTASFNPAGGGLLTTEGNEDIFVAKYDSNGTYQWALSMGNIGAETQERAWDISVDNQGNSFVTGGFHGTMNFNPLGEEMVYSISDNTAGIFLAKYNTFGLAQWVIVLDVKGNDVFTETYGACDLDQQGNLFLAGNFRGNAVNFDPLGTSTLLSSMGQNDIFIAKYSSENGMLNWVKQIGSNLQELVSPGALRCDNNGNPYFTGRLNGTNTVDFDPDQGSFPISNSSLYLCSLDTDGHLRFATGMNSGTGDGGHRVSFDSQNNVYLAGWMNGTATFGQNSLTAFALTADCFLAKFTNNLGSTFWALNFGGENSSANNIVAGLSVDRNDNPVITGQLFGTNANVDPLGQQPLFLSSVGNNDCFLIKYDAGGWLWHYNPVTVSQSHPPSADVVYPNPAFDKILLPVDVDPRVFIFDQQGRKTEAKALEGRLDIHYLEEGLYIVQYTDKQGRVCRSKFIKRNS